MCAGPGGKAALLAALADDVGAQLEAWELREHRARLVQQQVGPDVSVRVSTPPPPMWLSGRPALSTECCSTRRAAARVPCGDDRTLVGAGPRPTSPPSSRPSTDCSRRHSTDQHPAASSPMSPARLWWMRPPRSLTRSPPGGRAVQPTRCPLMPAGEMPDTGLIGRRAAVAASARHRRDVPLGAASCRLGDLGACAQHPVLSGSLRHQQLLVCTAHQL